MNSSTFKVQRSKFNVQRFLNSKFDIRYSKFGFKGFTLIELIIFIIIAGIFLPATYVAFSASMRSATQPEDYTRGRLLAEQAMELAKKRFSTNFVSNPSQVQADVTTPPTCAAIGVTAPKEWSDKGWDINTQCSLIPRYISYSGGAFSSPDCSVTYGSATNYICIVISITTPQGNTFLSTGMVTNHGF